MGTGMLENFRLRVFRSVAEHLNFRKAGEALYLTQPAVTLQIKTLEEELGTRLLERSASGVRLTEAGNILLQYARQLSGLAEQAEQEIANLKGKAAGELVIGASTTIAQYVLPPLLAEFAHQFPAVQIRVFSANTERITAGVASEHFGIGLIEGPPLRQDVKIKPWFQDELMVVVPVSHEWAEAGVIDAKRLREVPFVMRERGSGTRHVVEQGLQKNGLRLGDLQVAMELDSTEAILSCIEAGLGVGIVSKWALSRRIRAGSLATVQLAKHRITREFLFILPAAPSLPPTVMAMLQFLQEAVPFPL